MATFVYDAFLILSNAIIKYNLTDSIPLNHSVLCEPETPWSFGPTIIKHLKSTKMNGLTGHIEFDMASNVRTNLTIPIVDKIRNTVDLVSN